MDKRHAPGEEDALLTPGEVAGLFRVATATVYRWADSGRIPPEAIIRTFGGHRRYRETIIRKQLQAENAGEPEQLAA